MERPASPSPALQLTVKARDGESDAQVMARVTLTPAVKAACTIAELSAKHLPGVELNALVEQLAAQQSEAVTGNLEACQAMLIAQAHTLDALFHHLIRNAAAGSQLDYGRTCLQLALKAQNAARNTLATLASIQQPKSATFVKQANLQFNHGVLPEGRAGLALEEASPPLSCGISFPENELKRMEIPR